MVVQGSSADDKAIRSERNFEGKGEVGLGLAGLWRPDEDSRRSERSRHGQREGWLRLDGEWIR